MHDHEKEAFILGTTLALASAVLYGIVDFAGGRISRQINGIALALYVQLSGLVTMLVFAPVLPGTINIDGLLWGAVSGIGSGLAIMFLYTGMGKGKISLIVPLIAVVGAGIPVLIGITLLGERPAIVALVGVGLVFPAILLVSGGGRTGDGKWMAGFSDCLVAGAGVALQYAAIAHAPENSGLWPLVTNRAASIVLVLAYGRFVGAPGRVAARHVFSAAWIGALASISLAFYLLATRLSMMTITVVLASLYPVIPSILAIYILKERITTKQKLGLVLAILAVMLITMPESVI